MLINITAILCCGAQYVPLDGKVALRETIRRVVEQSGTRVVLCLESTAHRVTELGVKGCTAITVEDNTYDLELISYRKHYEEELAGLTTEESGCYVIYTSGTFSTQYLVLNRSMIWSCLHGFIWVPPANPRASTSNTAT